MTDKKKTSLNLITRIILFLSGVALFIVLIVPIWKIELTAPQYPEGLEMFIHADKLSGDIDIINGLNNYIGMRQIHENEFKEFLVLPYLIGFFAATIILVSILNKRKFLYVWFGLFLLFALVVGVDFYIWLYDYGHNLDPTAPIKVPGMTYQPPLIGFKQLLNFGAFSIPAIGGWLMIAVGAAVAGLVTFEYSTNKNKYEFF